MYQPLFAQPTTKKKTGRGYQPLFAGKETVTTAIKPEINLPTPKTSVIGNLWEGTKQAVREVLPSTTENVKSLVTPVSFKKPGLKQQAKDLYDSVVGTIEESLVEEGRRIEELTDFSKGRTTGEIAGQGLKATAGMLNVVFSPISAVFKAAETYPDSPTAKIAKLVTLPFSITGDVGLNAAKLAVDKLPISEKNKEHIKQGAEEIGTLTAQLILGGRVADKVGLESLLKGKKEELTNKYDADTADVIVKSAIEKATETTKEVGEPKQDFVKFLEERAKERPVEPKQEAGYKPLFAEEKKVEVKTPAKDPLIQEARKYKSAEEFVKAKATLKHRSITPDIKEFQPNEKGIFFTKDAYGERAFGKGDVHITNAYVDLKKPFIANKENVVKLYQENYGLDIKDAERLADDFEMGETTARQQVRSFIEDKHDGMIIPEDWDGGFGTIESVVAFDPKQIKTKSQLTDIWKKANETVIESKPETVKVPQSQLPVGTGKEKLSRMEARIKGRLDSLPENEKNLLTTYKEMNKAEQIKKAVDYVSKNPEEAMQVLEGNKPAPKGLLYNSISLAMEELSVGDVDLAVKLSSLRSTRAGQEISILTERDPHSPVGYMTDLIKRKIEIMGGKEKIKEVKAKEVSKLKQEIKKNNLAKTDWNAFVESIKC